MFYADVSLAAGSTLRLNDEHEQRAIYVVQGAVQIGSQLIDEGRLIVLLPGQLVRVGAKSPARLMLLGGARLDGARHLWWNFVSSSSARIEQAKSDWREGRFPAVPGESEFIPLPSTPPANPKPVDYP
jgi:hypothetical protein